METYKENRLYRHMRINTFKATVLLSSSIICFTAGADWAAWLPGTCQLERLVRRPGGPPLQMLKDGVERRKGAWSSSLGREGSPPINYLQGSRVPRYATAHGAGLPN